VYPALAVHQALQKIEPHTHEVLWVGGEGGMEAELVTRQGVPYRSIPAAGLHGVGWRALPKNLNLIRRGISASRQILRELKPDALFFTGGYVAAPMALAGRYSGGKRPAVVLYVPDIEPGMALNFLARFANKITVTASESRQYFSSAAQIEVTGYPVRGDLLQWEKSTAFRAFNLDQKLPVLFVWGGSKGARSINQALSAILPALLEQVQIIHISGTLDWPQVEARVEQLSPLQKSCYRPFPYLHDEMGAAYTIADLVVARAGASALGEFPMFALPAILVPYPYAWRYQKVNASYLENRGGALFLADEDLPARLQPLVLELINDPDRLRQMRDAMKSLARPQAAEAIARQILDAAGNGEPGVKL
jgi:undecaprenyldiphospho-muramoylpentapeptide beta-N-acetylglucosaminyltransferase